MEYITEAFCENKDKVALSCNGKCHLAKQLQIETDKQDSDKAVKISTEFFSLVFLEQTPNFNLNKKPFFHQEKISNNQNQSYNYAFEFDCFKPPAV